MLGRNIDGLILIPTYDGSATLDLLALRGTPTVIVDRVSSDKRFDSVAIDDRKAMREAIRAGASVKLGCDHTNYPQHITIAADTLASLAGDLR